MTSICSVNPTPGPLIPGRNDLTSSNSEICSEIELKETLVSLGIMEPSGMCSGAEEKASSLPEACLDRLHTILGQLIPVNTLGEVKLSELIARLDYDFEVVGSTVLYILGVDYLEALLKPYHITLSEALKADLSRHFPKGNDLDLRAPNPPKAPPFQGILCSAVAGMLGKEAYDILTNGFQKQHPMKGGQAFLATLGDGQGQDVDFIVYESLKRENFASRDALRLKISTETVLKAGASWLQPFLDQIFKTLRIDAPEAVDHNGWSRLLSLQVKGFIPARDDLEQTLLKTARAKNHTVQFLVSLIQNTAKAHLPNVPNGAIKMAYLGAQVLLKTLSPAEFCEFWQLIETEKDPYGYQTLFKDPKTPSREVLILLRMALPFMRGVDLIIPELKEAELVEIFKNFQELKKAFPLLKEPPFKSVEELLFHLILKAKNPYPLWQLVKAPLAAYEKRLQAHVMKAPELKEAFLSDPLFSLGVLQKEDNPELKLKLLKKLLANTVREAQESPQRHLSLLNALLEAALPLAEKLDSHDDLAKLILLVLPSGSRYHKNDLKIDLKKVSDPKLRFELAFCLQTYKCPFTFEKAIETLKAIKPEAESDPKLRELLKGGKLAEVPSSMIFSWIEAVQKTVDAQTLRPWLFLLPAVFPKELTQYHSVIEALLSKLIPALPNDLEGIWKLIELAEITAQPPLEQFVKACLQSKSKPTKELVWRAVAGIKNKELRLQALQKPNPHMVYLLTQDLSELPPSECRLLLEGVLSHAASIHDLQKHFDRLKELKEKSGPLAAWGKWLLTLPGKARFIEATEEILTLSNLGKADRDKWVRALLDLSLEETKTLDVKPALTLLLHKQVALCQQIKGLIHLAQFEAAIEKLKELKDNPTPYLESILDHGMSSCLHIREAVHQDPLKSRITEAERHSLLMKVFPRSKVLGMSEQSPRKVAILVDILIKDFYFLDSKQPRDINNIFQEVLLPLLQKQLSSDQDFPLLHVNIVKLTYVLSIHTLKRSLPRSAILSALQTTLGNLDKAKKLSSREFPLTGPFIDSRAPKKENVQLVLQSLSIPEHLLETLPPTEGARCFTSHYIHCFLKVLVANRAFYKYTFPLFDKLTTLITPSSSPFFKEHRHACLLSFIEILAHRTDHSDDLKYLVWRMRLDLEFHQLGGPFPNNPLQKYEFITYREPGLISRETGTAFQEEVRRLLVLKQPYALLSAILIFSKCPRLLFNSYLLSHAVWNEICSASIDLLFKQVEGRSIALYMAEALYRNPFLSDFSLGPKEVVEGFFRWILTADLKGEDSKFKGQALFQTLYHMLENNVLPIFPLTALDLLDLTLSTPDIWHGITDEHPKFIAPFEIVKMLLPKYARIEIQLQDASQRLILNWIAALKRDKSLKSQDLLNFIPEFLTNNPGFFCEKAVKDALK